MNHLKGYSLNVFAFREEVEDFFRSRDRDFDGYLSFEEFLGEESKLEKLFKKMDKNNDGKVSKQVNIEMSLLQYYLRLFTIIYMLNSYMTLN